MKKFIAYCLASVLSISLMTGCGNQQQGNSGQPQDATTQQQTIDTTQDTADGLQVVTSFYPLYILALNVTDGVEGVTVTNMTQPQTGCLHDYEMTTEDMKTLEGADIFVVNGLGMEHFLGDVQKTNPALYIEDTSKGARVMELESELEHNDDMPNPHIWLDPNNAIMQAQNICDALSQNDPANAAAYAKNTEAFAKSLSDVMQNIQTLQSQPEKKVAAFHEGFAYLAEVCNIDVETGIYAEEHQEPSAREMAEVSEDIREDGIQYLLAADDIGKKYADTLAAELGVTVLVLDPLTNGEMNKDAYRMGMEKNVQVLMDAVSYK